MWLDRGHVLVLAHPEPKLSHSSLLAKNTANHYTYVLGQSTACLKETASPTTPQNLQNFLPTGIPVLLKTEL